MLSNGFGGHAREMSMLLLPPPPCSPRSGILLNDGNSALQVSHFNQLDCGVKLSEAFGI